MKSRIGKPDLASVEKNTYEEISSDLKNKVARNSTFVLLGHIISLVANLAVNVLLARHLGQAGFGIFSYSLIFVGFFALIPDFGMQAILVRELSRKGWNSAELLGNVLLVRLGFSVLSILLAMAVARLADFSPTLLVTIAILSFNILFSSKLLAIRAIFEAPFQARLQMKTPISFQILDNLLLLATIAILLLGQARLETIVTGYVLANVPGLILMIVTAVRAFDFRLSVNRNLLKYILSQSFPLWIYSILLVLFGGADTVFLKEIFGEQAVGIYSAAFRLTSPLLFIPNLLIISLFPLFSRYYEHAEEQLARTFDLGLKVVLMLASALAIPTTFFSTDIIQLLYGNEYTASASVLVILMWCQVILFMNHYFANALTSVHRQSITFYAAAMMLVSNCIANWFLIRETGIIGAANAKLISSVLGTMVMFAGIYKNIATQAGLIFARVTIFCLLSLFVFAALEFLQENLYITIALGGPAMLLLAITVFSKKEIEIFKSMLPYLRIGSNSKAHN